MIICTSDYDQFGFDPRNRPINRKHVEDLKKSIQRNNFLDIFPIIVDSSLCVLDGQHRIIAARELGVRICYRVAPAGFTMEHVGLTNSNQEGWDYDDWLHYHSQGGNVHYLKLKALKQAWPFLINTGSTASMFTRRTQLNLKQAFKDGTYTLDEQLAAMTIRALVDFSDYHNIKPLISNSTFQKSINQLVRNPNYDHERMMDKLTYLSARVHKHATQREYVEELQDIYNYRHKEENRVKFTVRTTE